MMYNSDLPTRAELPSARQLLRSTVIAMVTAAGLLVTVVLPAEYAIDPTGAGRLLGLTEMGEIKGQLADEAEKDKRGAAPAAVPGQQSRGLERLINGLLIRPAMAQAAPAARTDRTVLVLKPGDGVEVKMEMKKGARVEYVWSTSGGAVNFDMHGDGGGQQTSYAKGRAEPGGRGVLEAAFDGNHGWFWRNRDKADVTVTLQTTGAYGSIRTID